jgi:hypothetical protein
MVLSCYGGVHRFFPVIPFPSVMEQVCWNINVGGCWVCAFRLSILLFNFRTSFQGCRFLMPFTWFWKVKIPLPLKRDTIRQRMFGSGCMTFHFAAFRIVGALRLLTDAVLPFVPLNDSHFNPAVTRFTCPIAVASVDSVG